MPENLHKLRIFNNFVAEKVSYFLAHSICKDLIFPTIGDCCVLSEPISLSEKMQENVT